MSYKSPEKLLYEYKLEGFEENWSPAMSANFATYTSLPSGEYKFLARAINSDGVVSVNPIEISFQITPPIWESIWFKILVGLGIIALMYGFHNLRMRKIRQDKAKLEAIVQERTEEIVAQKEEIQSYNDSLVERNAEVSQQKEEILTQRDDILQKAEQLSVFYKDSKEQNKKIGQSIRYAERIQKAMLPSERVVASYVPNNFIYHKPKDVVSGDSYWVGEIQDYTIIAAIDCTGHGVPGAIMTMASNLALSQIVNAEQISKPSEILSRLHVLIRTTLAQEESDIRDGMDLVLCAIDKQNKRIHFAGAKRAFLLVKDGKLESFKTDKHSIGGRSESVDFSDQSIPYDGETTFYLTSDGYQDQFGGSKNRKIGRKRFYSLLEETSLLPLAEQKERLATFIQKWQEEGDEEQIDDQVIIGFILSS
ncbi:MAG: serine phosphatase RsbU (regulator of sigma subunit) [Arenicella sp.]